MRRGEAPRVLRATLFFCVLGLRLRAIAGKLLKLDEESYVDAFVRANQEPGGSVCVAYVDEGGRNFKLIEKLMKAAEAGKDKALLDLQIPVGLARVGWQGTVGEMLVMTYRRPFDQRWTEANQTVPDGKNIVFHKKVGAVWKEKEVHKWLTDHAFPLINVRSLTPGDLGFPDSRYFGAGNTGGVALLFGNLTGDSQWSFSQMLRRHAERWRGSLRFSMADRTNKTREMRAFWGTGMNTDIDAELLVVQDVAWRPDDQDAVNFYHGHPRKYRLQNVTQKSVDVFFDSYERGDLKKYWISRGEWLPPDDPRFDMKVHNRLDGSFFDTFVFDDAPERARLVAFFNDDEEDGCVKCEEGREVWEEAVKEARSKKAIDSKVDFASIDQSLNEHSEFSVPHKLGQPMVMWYPRGSRRQRERGRRNIMALAQDFKAPKILESVEDLILEMEEGGEL